MLATIMDLIRRPKATADEYREALAKIDVPAAEAVVEALEAKRRIALVQNDDAVVDEIDRELKAANRDVDRCHAAKEDLERLIEQSEKTALEDKINGTAQDSRAARARMLRRYVEIDAKAAELAELLKADRDDFGLIKRGNEFIRSQGRSDLGTRLPLGEVVALGGRDVRDFLSEWVLPNYWPRLRDFGTMDRTLGRSKEIQ